MWDFLLPSRFVVDDVASDVIFDSNYDLSIFCSGYESRSASLFERFLGSNIGESICFGNSDHLELEIRRGNDQIFRKCKEFHLLDGCQDESRIANIVRNKIVEKSKGGAVRVLVDYSSMRRGWYAAILNAIRFTNWNCDVIVDMAYSVGRHDLVSKADQIGKPYCVKGCEGRVRRSDKTVVAVGLGFDQSVPSNLIENLEPENLYAFYANPAGSNDYPGKCLSANEAFITDYLSGTPPIPLPISSVSYTCRGLYEVVAKDLDEYSVTFLAFGPKPHVLACMLLSMSTQKVALLHADKVTFNPQNVIATGNVIATRLSISKKELLVN